jgi:hypothetical protein
MSDVTPVEPAKAKSTKQITIEELTTGLKLRLEKREIDQLQFNQILANFEDQKVLEGKGDFTPFAQYVE